METINEDTTKRLSFGDVTQGLLVADPLNVEDVIKAVKSPSVDNFQRALTILSESCENRSNYITEAAKEQSASIGEADLRRLKRQFSSLKNTFTHYEVKDEFIAALADGLPNGTEDIQLAQFEEEAARNIETLRKMKAANEQSQTELASIIAGIHQLLEDINIQNGHTQSIISQVAHDIQEDALAHEAMPPLPPNGADEDGCQADLAEEAALAQSLEADIIAISNELSDVEAALAKEKDECEREEEEVSEVEASLEEIMRRLQALADKGGVPSSKDQEIHQEDIKKALQAKENAKSKRLRALSMWTEEAISLLQKLGGVVIPTIVHQQGSQSLEVTLGTAFPTDPVLSAHDVPVACSKVEHRLMLQLDASGYAAEAALTPADVYIADIVMQLSPDKTFRPSPGHVVREVRTRICQVSHRNALIHAASAKFPGIATLDPTLADSFTCPMTVRGVKFTVTISMEECWPMSVDRPEVVSIVSDADCESDTIIDLANRTVAGMTLEGDLTVSLQEVERALYSILQDPK